MSAGSVTVELLAKTGSFETDMGRAAKETERLQRSIERQIAALKRQAETAGLDGDQLKIYALRQKQASDEQLKAAQAAIDARKSVEQQVSNSSVQKQATEAIERQVAALREQAATYGKTADEITLMALAQKGATAEQLKAAEAAIAARRALEKASADSSAQKQATEAIDRQVAALQQQAAAAGKTADEVTLLALAQRGATAEQLKAAEAAIAARRANEQQGKTTAASQQFIATLREEAEAAGRTRIEMLELKAAKLGLAAEAAPLIARLKASETQMGKLGPTTAQTAQQMQFAAIQVKDFAQSVIAGQNPLIAFTQQGLTTVSIFGGVGNTLRAFGALLTPARLAIGGVTAALITFVTAAYLGREQSTEFQKSLILTRNAAGLTAGAFDDLAKSVSTLGSGTIGNAREALQGLVSTGAFGPASLEAAGVAVLNLERLTGKAADAIIGDFKGMRDNTLSWAYESNKAYNFLTPKIYEQIRALQAAGKADEARKVTLDALNESLGKQAPNALGILERALKSAKEAASSFWDSLLAVGRPSTLEQEIAQQLKVVESAMRGREDPPTMDTFGRRRASGAERLAAAQEQLQDLYAQKDFRDRMAKGAADSAKENREALEREQQSYLSATQQKDLAAAQVRFAAHERAYAIEERALEESYRLRYLSELGYVQASEKLAREQIQARLNLLAASTAAESSIKPTSPAETVAKEGRLLQLQAQRLAILRDLDELNNRSRLGNFFPKNPLPAVETRQTEFIKQERAQQPDLEAQQRDRRAAAIEQFRDLNEASKALNAALIKDDHARAKAQLELELDTLKKRLDLGALNADERKKAEDDLATYIALRQEQLTEELKPAYQKQLEAWQDNVRLMREASEEFHTSFIDEGRKAFTEWVKNGKFSLKGLADAFVNTFLNIVFKQTLANPLNDIASSIFGSAFKPLLDGSTGGSKEKQQSDALAKLVLNTGVADNSMLKLATAAELAASALSRISVSSAGNVGSGFFNLFGDAIKSSNGYDYNTIGALEGARARGGATRSRGLYKVVEDGPELLETGGQTYLMMGSQGGRVIPNTAGRKWATGGVEGGPVIHQSFQFASGVNANEMRAFAERIKHETIAAIADQRMRGSKAFT